MDPTKSAEEERLAKKIAAVKEFTSPKLNSVFLQKMWDDYYRYLGGIGEDSPVSVGRWTTDLVEAIRDVNIKKMDFIVSCTDLSLDNLALPWIFEALLISKYAPYLTYFFFTKIDRISRAVGPAGTPWDGEVHKKFAVGFLAGFVMAVGTVTKFEEANEQFQSGDSRGSWANLTRGLATFLVLSNLEVSKKGENYNNAALAALGKTPIPILDLVGDVIWLKGPQGSFTLMGSGNVSSEEALKLRRESADLINKYLTAFKYPNPRHIPVGYLKSLVFDRLDDSNSVFIGPSKKDGAEAAATAATPTEKVDLWPMFTLDTFGTLSSVLRCLSHYPLPTFDPASWENGDSEIVLNHVLIRFIRACTEITFPGWKVDLRWQLILMHLSGSMGGFTGQLQDPSELLIHICNKLLMRDRRYFLELMAHYCHAVTCTSCRAATISGEWNVQPVPENVLVLPAKAALGKECVHCHNTDDVRVSHVLLNAPRHLLLSSQHVRGHATSSSALFDKVDRGTCFPFTVVNMLDPESPAPVPPQVHGPGYTRIGEVVIRLPNNMEGSLLHDIIVTGKSPSAAATYKAHADSLDPDLKVAYVDRKPGDKPTEPAKGRRVMVSVISCRLEDDSSRQLSNLRCVAEPTYLDSSTGNSVQEAQKYLKRELADGDWPAVRDFYHRLLSSEAPLSSTPPEKKGSSEGSSSSSEEESSSEESSSSD